MSTKSSSVATRRFPEGSRTTDGLAWGFSFQLLPYMEEKVLFESVDMTSEDCGQVVIALQAAKQLDPSSSLVDLLVCPSDPNGGQALLSGPNGQSPQTADAGLLYPGSYLGVSGTNESNEWCPQAGMADGDGIFYTNSKLRARDVRDGLSKTLMLGERGIPKDLGWGWPVCGGTECEHYTSTRRGLSAGGNLPWFTGILQRFWSWHDSGAYFAMSDGSVHYLTEGIDGDSFQALSTRSGREVAELP